LKWAFFISKGSRAPLELTSEMKKAITAISGEWA
jgi:hypothetical protein